MDIHLYVLDSLRPDFLGCYGEETETSPRIDEFSDDSVVFMNAYAPASWTKPSGAALLTGEYPRALNMNHTYSRLDSSVPLLPEILGNNGYTTVGVTAQGFLSKKFGLERGYDRYENLRDRPAGDDDRVSGGMASDDRLFLPDSRDLNETLLSLIPSGARDLFTFTWAVDTHDPYFVLGEDSHFGNTGEEYVMEGDLSKFVRENGIERLKSLYRDMIRYNDRSLGELLDWLRETGRYHDSVIVVTADHGESFGEHGELGHAGHVHEEQIRVPLLLKLPGEDHQSTRVDTPVSLVDVFETVLSVAGIESDATPDGRNLIEVVEGRQENRPILAETFPTPGDAHSRAIRWKSLKQMSVDYPRFRSLSTLKEQAKWMLNIPDQVRWRDSRLYDVDSEGNTRHLGDAEIPDEMRTAARALIRSLDERATKRRKQEWTPHSDDDREVEDRLRQLGYID